MSLTRPHLVAGQIVHLPLTPEELAQREADEAASAQPTPEAPLALSQIACARLTIDGGDVSGVERSTGIAGAFAFGDTVLAFFEAEQPDIDYTVTPDDGAEKYTDHVEITRPSLTSIAFIICRVQ